MSHSSLLTHRRIRCFNSLEVGDGCKIFKSVEVVSLLIFLWLPPAGYFLPIRIWRMLVVISLWTQLCYRRTGGRTDTITSCPVSHVPTDRIKLVHQAADALRLTAFLLFRWLDEGQAVLHWWWPVLRLHQCQLHPSKISLQTLHTKRKFLMSKIFIPSK